MVTPCKRYRIVSQPKIAKKSIKTLFCVPCHPRSLLWVAIESPCTTSY